MRPFSYQRPGDLPAAVAATGGGQSVPPTMAAVRWIAAPIAAARMNVSRDTDAIPC